jgi:hypothetical protein
MNDVTGSSKDMSIAEQVRCSVGYLARHAKGLSMTQWDLHSNFLLDASVEIERLQRENEALRNLAENLRPGPISEALAGSMAADYARAGIEPRVDLPLSRAQRIERLSPEEFATIRAIADKTVAGSTFRKLLWQIEQLEAGIAELIAEPRAAQPPSVQDLALARNCLGNLYMAVARYGVRSGTLVDNDVKFAMYEAAQFLGPPYSTATKEGDGHG